MGSRRGRNNKSVGSGGSDSRSLLLHPFRVTQPGDFASLHVRRMGRVIPALKAVLGSGRGEVGARHVHLRVCS